MLSCTTDVASSRPAELFRLHNCFRSYNSDLFKIDVNKIPHPILLSSDPSALKKARFHRNWKSKRRFCFPFEHQHCNVRHQLDKNQFDAHISHANVLVASVRHSFAREPSSRSVQSFRIPTKQHTLKLNTHLSAQELMVDIQFIHFSSRFLSRVI